MLLCVCVVGVQRAGQPGEWQGRAVWALDPEPQTSAPRSVCHMPRCRGTAQPSDVRTDQAIGIIDRGADQKYR